MMVKGGVVVAKNLNVQTVSDDCGNPVVGLLGDNSIRLPVGASALVFFRNLEQHAVEFIYGHEAIVGCVAWLTNEAVLTAMADRASVSLVVQKEDFLRPDSGKSNGKLRGLYAALCSRMGRNDEGLDGTALSGLSCLGDPSIDAVRCVGNYNRDKRPAMPRMHNKFLVGGSLEGHEYNYTFKPESVWTGSFNMTHNATQSLENAVVLKSDVLATRYFREWAQICAISEPLNWDSDWSAPEWRLGT